MKVSGVHSVFLVVSDLPRSVSYYTNILGAEASQHGNLATFHIGDVQLLLHAEGENLKPPAGYRRGAGVALHFRVKDIDSHWNRLKGLGIPIAEEPANQPYGMREFGLRDPDGYEVEFVEPL